MDPIIPQPTTESTPPAPLFKKRANKNIRKRAATPPPASDSDYTSSEDESGARIKRRKRNTGAVNASSKSNPNGANNDLSATIYSASRNTTIKSSNDATKASNWYDETAPSALSAKNLLGSTRNVAVAGEAGDGTYKGLANSTKFIAKNPDAPNRSVGPVKAPTNIRTVTTTDFAPDVCKDYKQTGFCGFGDSCKFLHAREDYKQGWQLDREWENVTKGKKVVSGTKMASADRKGAEEGEEEDDAALENIPFACVICREKYKEPIVTRCGHYFCEGCALKRYRKDPSCAACGSGTGGVFNVARGLKKLLERKRERVRKRREAAIEKGESLSEEEEEEE